jgi:hypothetical protein
MAVGRNLSYTRDIFGTVRGFDHSSGSLSGDDDLLVQAAAKRGVPVRHLFGEGAIVPTRGPDRWSEWLRQKRRHASAGRYYGPAVKAHLFAYHTSAHVLWLAPVLAGLPGLLLLAARLAMLRLVLGRPAAEFGERDLLAGLPLWELIYALYNLLVAPVGVLFGPRVWRTGSER